MAWLFGLVAVAVVVTALRSTWSPCSLSMLSSMTPLSERSRGHRWGVTVSWYVLGAVVGGLTTGALLAVPAALVGLADLDAAIVLASFAAVGLVAAAADADVVRLPWHGRQVDEAWFDRYRPWAYASGFGWQVGTGFATFLTTAGLYLTAAGIVLTGSPRFAVAAGAAFGLIRGLMALPGGRLGTFEAMTGAHQRLDAWAEPSRRLTAAAMAILAVVALVAAGLAGAVVAVALAAVVVAIGRAVLGGGARLRLS
jgi:MFS family permease